MITETCDDCRTMYASPAYYTFDPNDCTVSEDGSRVEHDCTGNICPECAGPFLTPDKEGDARRPQLTTDEILEFVARDDS